MRDTRARRELTKRDKKWTWASELARVWEREPNAIENVNVSERASEGVCHVNRLIEQIADP